MAKTQSGQQNATARKATGTVTVKSRKTGIRQQARDLVARTEVSFAGPRVTLRDGKQIIPSAAEVIFRGTAVEGVQYLEKPRQREGMVAQTAPVIVTPAQKAILPISEDPMHIAQSIRQFDIKGHPAWKSLSERVPGAKVFAIECSPTSVDLREGGKFSTRARLLVEVPKTLSSGRKSFGSVTVPAFVVGTLKGNGELKIEEFRLSVEQPAESEHRGRDTLKTPPSEQQSLKTGLEDLSPRENQIVSYLLKGFSNKQIAKELSVAEATIKVHMKAILRKLRVSNSAEAARLVAERLHG